MKSSYITDAIYIAELDNGLEINYEPSINGDYEWSVQLDNIIVYGSDLYTCLAYFRKDDPVVRALLEDIYDMNASIYWESLPVYLVKKLESS